MTTEANETTLKLNSSLTGLEYGNVLKNSVTNPLITPPLLMTNRTKKEEGLLLRRNFQCYSQMNDKNIDYSESGYSMNLKSHQVGCLSETSYWNYQG